MSRFTPDWLVMRAARLPEEPAIRTETIAWTRQQMLEASDGLAAALHDAGIERGHRLGSLLVDDAPAVVLINAARRLGAVLIPLNRRAPAPDLGQQLVAAKADALVFDRSNAALAEGCAAHVPSSLKMEALLGGSPCADRSFLRDEVDLDDPAVIVFTSGTSGRPKGALLTHGNLAASAHAWAELLRPRDTDRWLACLPLFHVAGLAIVTRSARWGVELEIADRFDAQAVSQALDEGVSHLSLVPVQLEALLAVRQARPTSTSLRAILLGGGPIPPTLLARARRAGYPVLSTYGMTETASGIAVGGADAMTLADVTAGRPLHRAELRIADPDPADGSGEILVRGPMVFAGYVDAPSATARALRDGWLHTGDIGSISADGLLRIADRRDDLFVSGGENVYPAEVEQVLRLHPLVADVAVAGQPDERWGAVPVAWVVAVDGAVIGGAELEKHCRDRLASYKVPTGFLQVPELPRDDLGKVRRRDLSELIPETK